VALHFENKFHMEPNPTVRKCEGIIRLESWLFVPLNGKCRSVRFFGDRRVQCSETNKCITSKEQTVLKSSPMKRGSGRIKKKSSIVCRVQSNMKKKKTFMSNSKKCKAIVRQVSFQTYAGTWSWIFWIFNCKSCVCDGITWSLQYKW
jgi:hypothetical protein